MLVSFLTKSSNYQQWYCSKTHSYFSRSLWCKQTVLTHNGIKKLPLIDGLLDAQKNILQQQEKPLYSSHMIDLSEEQ
jgi:fructose/tagatose bisphosphate aldolase